VAKPMTGKHRPLVITTGEPAGIGPDISLMLAQQAHEEGWLTELALTGDPGLLRARALLLGLGGAWLDGVRIDATVLRAPATPGRLDTANAAYVLQMLDRAIDGCQTGEYAGMVTAPLQKSVIADSGMAFSGHTEYLAEKTATATVVMMLACPAMRVALATTHLPLAQVAAHITPAGLRRTLQVLLNDLQSKFGHSKPRVLVTGLNPHAGEGGHLGREEIEIIEPVVRAFQAQGHAVSGPYPADTVFQPKYLQNADAVLAMYHDQGLPVLKYAGFGAGVNITLGLPFIRTSVDHGTALDLAGTGRAQAGSLRAAVDMARAMVRKQAARHG
jgi:4-hydroxythreonine-4-phosphate dehydrogenase